jgi:DNA-binding beta-propeller fold protein YncE
MMISYTSQGQEITLQETVDTSYRIAWLKEFPGRQGEKSNKKFKDKVESLITGANIDNGLSKPVSMIVASEGTWWILDQAFQSIFKVEDGVGDLPHFKKTKDIILPSLVGICNFSNGRVLFTDSYLNKIFILDPSKKTMAVWNDSIRLEQPTGIAYNAINKQVWVSETKSHRVALFDEEGIFIKYIGKRGTSPGDFNFPTSIWIDNSGTIFIVDAMNFRIQVFNSDGTFKAVFGEPGDATGYFARPKGVATDSYGHIYVADALFHAVQVFDIKGNFLYSFGNQGREEGEFWMPSGIFIDADNNIYVADTYNSRIQVFKLVIGGSP